MNFARYERERALASLDDRSDAELYRMLDDETQEKLWTNFVEQSLDTDDRCGVIDRAMNGTLTTRDRANLRTSWNGYLATLDLRNAYDSQLQDAVLAA